MKRSFQAYYRPSEETFKELWSKCLFVPDTNMLLDIYRYSEATRKELIGILERISPQLWIPYHVGIEYQRCRPEVILQQEKAYDDVKKILDESELTISKKLNISQSHPSINKTEILKQIKKSFASIQKGLNKQKSQHPDLLESDPLRDEITALFDGKVGEEFQSNKLDEIYKKGEERYKKKIPPGYMDEKKEGNEKYGDIVIWFQMIEKAKASQKPIIFITDDDKEDWWLWAKERRIGPRAELIEEMLNSAGQAFYMYGVERFMEYSRIFLRRSVDEKAIKEVRDVRKQSENRIVEILADVRMDVAKSLATRKQALENIFASPTGPRLADLVASRVSPNIADYCSSATSQTLADYLTPSANDSVKNYFELPTGKTLSDYLTPSANETMKNFLESPTNQTLAEIMAASTSQTVKNYLETTASQTIADIVASQVRESIQMKKIQDESTDEKKPQKDKDQPKEE